VETVRIVVGDGNPAVLRQLVRMLTAEFEVVGTAENGHTALLQIRQHKPAVVVLDLEMPLLNGLGVMQQLRASGSMPGIVICSLETNPEVIEEARKAGALGYVFKTRVADDLIAAVKAAARSQAFLSSL
jgi:DNA-binding NarL/FixJ family response regulator